MISYYHGKYSKFLIKIEGAVESCLDIIVASSLKLLTEGIKRLMHPKQLPCQMFINFPEMRDSMLISFNFTLIISEVHINKYFMDKMMEILS